MADTYDWPTITTMRDEAWPNPWTWKGRSPFKGHNFLSDDIIALLTTTTGHCVEVSTGWFLDHRIYGFTTNDPRAESSCFHDWGELVEAVKELTG